MKENRRNHRAGVTDINNLDSLNTASGNDMRGRAYSSVDMEYFTSGHNSTKSADQR